MSENKEGNFNVNVQMAVAREPYHSHDRRMFGHKDSYLTLSELSFNQLMLSTTVIEGDKVTPVIMYLTNETAKTLYKRLREFLNSTKPIRETSWTYDPTTTEEEESSE